MIRIIIVDPQILFCQGLKVLLDQESDFEVIGFCDQGSVGLELVELHNPDIVIVDGQLDLIRLFSQKCKILVLSSGLDITNVKLALSYGVKGYLLKGINISDLVKAIHFIYNGYSQFESGLLSQIMLDQIHLSKLARLTARERDILKLLAQGATNREIANSLCLAEGTVKNYMSQILERLELRDRTQAAILANQLVDLL